MPQARSGRAGNTGSGSKPKSGGAAAKTSATGSSAPAKRAAGASKPKASSAKASSARAASTKAASATAAKATTAKASNAKASSAKATTTTNARSAQAKAAAVADARLEAAAQRLRKLNERIIEAGKEAGETTLTSYEKALKAIAGSIERGPGSSDIDWISHLATTQAKFIRDVTAAWTSAARGMLK